MGGAGAWAGRGVGNAEKHILSQAIERGGAGKRVGGPCFSGPCPPRNELYSGSADMAGIEFNTIAMLAGSLYQIFSIRSNQ